MTREDLYVVLVTGSRHLDYAGDIERDLKEAKDLAEAPFRPKKKMLVVVHGGARGADSIAARAAEKLGAVTIECKANWNHFGKAAGPIRNSAMCALFEFDEILQYPSSDSRGTTDCVRKARLRPEDGT
jgi:hypothetical protein